MHILVDTNIYLDLLLDRGKQAEVAVQFFKNAILTKSKIFISSMSLRDIGYIVSRAFHNQEKGKDAQLKAYSMCHEVLNLRNDYAIEALYSDMNDYEDALIVESAKGELIDLIITDNIKDFEKSKFPVWTPEFFNTVINNKINEYEKKTH